MAESQELHHQGLQYYLLLLGAWLIRLPASFAQSKAMQKSLESLPSDVDRKRIQIPSRESGRSITVDVYEKKADGGAMKSSGDKKKIHINCHGSGFVIPSLGTDIDFCALLASKTNTTVFDCDYRKAPEHPFPAAPNDIQDVLNYISNHAADFDIEHITISGFSAGAALAMTTAVNYPPQQAQSGMHISGLVSIYGNPDMTNAYAAPDVKAYNSGVVLPDWLRTFFYKCYILPDQDRADTRLSAAYESRIDKWPDHVFLACGTADSLHESGERLVQKLKGLGHADVEFLSVEREAHAFDKGVKVGSQTETRRNVMYEKAVELVLRAHGK